jgi:hypothetical protein
MPNTKRSSRNRDAMNEKGQGKQVAASQARPSSRPRPKGRSKGEDGRPRDRKAAG